MAHTPHPPKNHQPRAEIMSEELAEKAEDAAKKPPFTGNQQPPRWDPPPEHGDAA